MKLKTTRESVDLKGCPRIFFLESSYSCQVPVPLVTSDGDELSVQVADVNGKNNRAVAFCGTIVGAKSKHRHHLVGNKIRATFDYEGGVGTVSF